MLLHILEEEHPDVRILSTGGPDLLKMVSDSSFRDNLFFILRQTSISVSPLRESTDDIADYLLTKYARRNDARSGGLTPVTSSYIGLPKPSLSDYDQHAIFCQ